MRVLPIGLAFIRGCGWLLVGIGLMFMVFASRQVEPWPQTGVGAAIAAIGFGLLFINRACSQRFRECTFCKQDFLADAVKCPYCGAWSMDSLDAPADASGFPPGW
jgi:hypothetical protein